MNIGNLKKNDYPQPVKTIAAIHKKINIRWDSTSGGAFSALAEVMYERGGFVSGAIYNEDFSVRNYISNNPADIEKLRSSKYLQSKAEGLYSEIRDLLRQGEPVIATQTHLQIN